MPQKYLLMSDSKIEPLALAGTYAYECVMHDYGSASDDTRITGEKHVSLTLKPDGDYPFFTHPEHLLKRVE